MNLIDRQTAIDALRKAYWDNNIQSAKDDPCIVDAMTDWAIRQIKALPSAQPERKKGEWIPHKSIFGGLGERVYTCDQCSYNIGFHTENFCPSCGADMRGDTRHG